MNPELLQYWFTLSNIEGVGWATSRKLLAHFNNSISDLFAASRTELEATGASEKLVKAILSAKPADLSEVLNWLSLADNHRVITPDSSFYPRLLKETANPPMILFAKGNADLLHQPQIAIVGTRNPSVGGREAAESFTRVMCEQGLTITSGLALGVDGIAHQTALDSGGTTIAVMGTGIDRIYPARHQALAHRIAEQGLILSEFPLGTGVRGSHFPKRNRIISGLSLGVLVVEAALKSGSLITAHFAVEQGRDVFAIPGSIHNTLAKGCHALIKQGALLVETADDILQHLGWLAKAQMEVDDNDVTCTKSKDLAPEVASILHEIDFSPTPLDVLVERCKKSVADLSAILLTLELEGWIVQATGGYQRQK